MSDEQSTDIEKKVAELDIDEDKQDQIIDLIEEEKSKELAEKDELGDKPKLQVETPPEEERDKFRKFKLEQQKLFLESFSETLNISETMRRLRNDDDVEFDIQNRNTIYRAKEESEWFRQKFEEAKQVALDRYEWEMRQYAVEGKTSMKKYGDDGQLEQERIQYEPEMLKTLYKLHSDKMEDNSNSTPEQIELIVNPQSESDMKDVDPDDVEIQPNKQEIEDENDGE